MNDRRKAASASSETTATEELTESTGTEETTATEATVTTGTSRATRPEQEGPARRKRMDQKKTADQKNPEDVPVQKETDSRWTLIPVGASRRARSTRTTSSAARRRELEAREELARLELEPSPGSSKASPHQIGTGAARR